MNECAGNVWVRVQAPETSGSSLRVWAMAAGPGELLDRRHQPLGLKAAQVDVYRASLPD